LPNIFSHNRYWAIFDILAAREFASGESFGNSLILPTLAPKNKRD